MYIDLLQKPSKSVTLTTRPRLPDGDLRDLEEVTMQYDVGGGSVHLDKNIHRAVKAVNREINLQKDIVMDWYHVLGEAYLPVGFSPRGGR